MVTILENTMIVPNICMITVAAPAIARSVKAGQFVIVRVQEDGERIPLTVCDWDIAKGTITLVYLLVGKTTQKLATLTPNDQLATVVDLSETRWKSIIMGRWFAWVDVTGSGASIPLPERSKRKGIRSRSSSRRAVPIYCTGRKSSKL
jgi:hypothetical protein